MDKLIWHEGYKNVVDLSVTNGQNMLIIFLLYVPKRYFSDVNVRKLEESSRAMLPFRRVCLWRHNHFRRETGRVACHPPHVDDRLVIWANRVDNSVNMGEHLFTNIYAECFLISSRCVSLFWQIMRCCITFRRPMFFCERSRNKVGVAQKFRLNR